MHIPDGFLDTKTAITSGVFSATGLGVSLRHAGRHLKPKKIPLIGLAAAFIFVAQMLNFPVASGTSGHLLGATFAAVLLGPSASVIVMSSVLIVQSLIFADGGILALGANAFNMAIVAPLSGYAVYRIVRVFLRGEQGQLVAAGFAAWCSTVLAAICCAGELASSGTVAWANAFPAMTGIHMLTGIGEAAITMLVIAAIAKTRPELLRDTDALSPSVLPTTFVYVAVIVIGVLLLVAPHASSFPDGLEFVASRFGFDRKTNMTSVLSPPLKEYQTPGIQSSSMTILTAGGIGAAAVFALSFLLARILVPKNRSEAGL